MEEWNGNSSFITKRKLKKKKKANVKFCKSGLQIIDTFLCALTLAMQNSGHLPTSFKGAAAQILQ